MWRVRGADDEEEEEEEEMNLNWVGRIHRIQIRS